MSTNKNERSTVARWIVRERPNGTRYWSGRLMSDDGKHEQEALLVLAEHFAVGTTIVCREPTTDEAEVARLKTENERLRKIAAFVPARVYLGNDILDSSDETP